MLIEQIDPVCPEPFQGCVGDRADLRRTAVQPGHLALLDVEAELRGDCHLITHGLERLAHDIFVGVRTVHFGGIEECHATINGSPDDRDTVLAAARPSIALADAHAAEAEGRHLET